MNRRNSHALTEAETRRIEDIDRMVVHGAVQDLIAVLGEKSWTVRRAIIAALASLGDDAVMPLCTWLRDVRSSEAAIAAAVDALSASIGTTVARHVFSLLLADNPAVAADGAQILGRRRTPEAASRLASLVNHEDDNVSVASIEALGAIGGTAAVDALIHVVESRRFFRTFPAIQVLARTGDPRAVAPLSQLLADDAYRLEVVRALGRTGSAAAIGAIISVLRSPSDSMVRLVALSLSELLERAQWNGSAEHVTSVMRDALGPWLGRFASAIRGSDPEERAAIAHLLGRVGDASVLPTITAMLEDDATANVATDALAYLGRTSDQALINLLAKPDSAKRITILPLVRSLAAGQIVRTLVHEDDPEVRARAIEALARIGDVASVPLMFEALGDTSPRVAHAAVSAILTLGTGETERLALEAARSAQPNVRRHGIRLLGAFGFVSAFETLVAATRDPDIKIVELATVGLGVLDDTRVDAELAKLAESATPAVRASTMRAAGQRGGQLSHALLVRGIQDADPWVRYYAAQGMGKLGTVEAPDIIERLVEGLRDEAPQVRVAAIEALSRTHAPAAWDAVCKAATSSDADERRAGLVGVGMQARPGACAILVAASKSDDHATRLVALAGLARLHDPVALETLDAAVADSSPEIRDAALSLLAERDDEAAAKLLVTWLMRAEASHPVHRVISRPGHNRIAAIMGALANADARTAPLLVAALARMGTEASATALFDALTLPSSASRSAAACSLISLGASGAVRTVTTLAAADPDPDVRRTLRAALAST